MNSVPYNKQPPEKNQPVSIEEQSIVLFILERSFKLVILLEIISWLTIFAAKVFNGAQKEMKQTKAARNK